MVVVVVKEMGSVAGMLLISPQAVMFEPTDHQSVPAGDDCTEAPSTGSAGDEQTSEQHDCIIVPMDSISSIMISHHCDPMSARSVRHFTVTCTAAFLLSVTTQLSQKNVKLFPTHKTHRAVLIAVSSTLSQTPVYTARPWIRGHGIARRDFCAPAFAAFAAFAGTHCTYPRRDGQAELTWVAGYIPRWDGLPVC